MSSGVGIYQGPEQVVEAATALLTDPETHLVLVQGLVEPSHHAELRRTHRQHRANVLYREAPRLREVSDLMQDHWDEEGYVDFALDNEFVNTDTIAAGESNGSHIDSRFNRNALRGGLTISLAFGSSAEWQAKKPSKPMTNSDGEFSRSRYVAWGSRIFLGAYSMTDWVEQRPGDAVIITQHPWPAVHQVKAQPTRCAYLFDLPIHRLPR